MLLSLRSQCAVVNDGAVGDSVRAVVDGHRRSDEVAVGVLVARADFRELTRSPTDGILMAISAGSGIEYRAQPGAGVVILLETDLVERIGVAWGFCDAVANALRSGVMRERRCVKTGGSFGWRLLRNGGAPAVIISSGLWRDRFGSSAAALGKSIVLDGVETTVVGVLQPGFRFGTDYADGLYTDRTEETRRCERRCTRHASALAGSGRRGVADRVRKRG